MSASLVGSEMCIRDSSWPERAFPASAQRRQLQQHGPGTARLPKNSPTETCLLYTSDAADDM
eukprot:13287017-Alexandrium_andersonii.AAC.1